MKLAKWLVVIMVVGVVAGGAIVIKSRAAEARQLNAALGVGGAQGQLGARIAMQLGLTLEQRQQIRAVLAGDKDKLTTLLTTAHGSRENLRTSIRTAGASENEIRGASATVAAAEADLAVERAALYGKISPILTADQLAKLNQLQQRADDLVDGAIAGLGRRLTD